MTFHYNDKELSRVERRLIMYVLQEVMFKKKEDDKNYPNLVG